MPEQQHQPETDVPEGLAHTCYCERLAYAHLSSTASGCPRVECALAE